MLETQPRKIILKTYEKSRKFKEHHQEINQIQSPKPKDERLHTKYPKQSLRAFVKIKTQTATHTIINNSADSQSSIRNDSVLYASLIMNRKLYESLGEEKLSTMSLKRIHKLSFHHNYEKCMIFHTIPAHILGDDLIETTSLETFLEIQDIIKKQSDEGLLKGASVGLLKGARILEGENLGDNFSVENNKTFAKILLSDEKIEVLGEDAISSIHMTPERMITIEKKLTIEWLEIFGDFIYDENMTPERLTLIANQGNPETIQSMDLKEIVKMEMHKLVLELIQKN